MNNLLLTLVVVWGFNNLCTHDLYIVEVTIYGQCKKSAKLMPISTLRQCNMLISYHLLYSQTIQYQSFVASYSHYEGLYIEYLFSSVCIKNKMYIHTISNMIILRLLSLTEFLL